MANVYLIIFVMSFIGCVFATPVVTRIAAWSGAIDRPDQFRRIHKGAIPRMGGLGLAFGLAVSLLPILAGAMFQQWSLFSDSWTGQWAIVAAAGIILVVGVIDDAVGIGPRVKLLGQTLAVVVLFAGGVRIEKIALLGLEIPMSFPQTFALGSNTFSMDLPSFGLTLVWFLGCMNVWNLIDGMDGLASGVGLLVSGTLMLVALYQGNLGSAALAASLAGGLAGFLLYNWHPACIFLGDSGSLLIGLLIGVIGVQDSLKGTTAVSILFPLLAMGLPISDTMMAIFRRWVRNLPLSSADRRHVHHLLIGLGLNPRQAALLLYSLTGFLCGVVLIGVAYKNEFLALVLGISGCLAFLLILTSRRDELTMLIGDLQMRGLRKKQERVASKETWESIQKIELCETARQIWTILLGTSQLLGSNLRSLACDRGNERLFLFEKDSQSPADNEGADMSGATATFRLPSGPDMQLIVSLHHASDSPLAADIAFRSLQRLLLASSQRLERLIEGDESSREEPATHHEPRMARGGGLVEMESEWMISMPRNSIARESRDWFRDAADPRSSPGPHGVLGEVD